MVTNESFTVVHDTQQTVQESDLKGFKGESPTTPWGLITSGYRYKEAADWSASCIFCSQSEFIVSKEENTSGVNIVYF